VNECIAQCADACASPVSAGGFALAVALMVGVGGLAAILAGWEPLYWPKQWLREHQFYKTRAAADKLKADITRVCDED
jgi:hypothetical protein